MAFPTLLALLAVITIAPGIMIFFSRRILHSVLFLAAAAAGSSLIFLYLSQTLAALLQLLIFVGGLSTYLIVAVATEERKVMKADLVKFLSAALLIAVAFSYIVYGTPGTQMNGNSFSYSAEAAFSGYSAFLFAVAFLLFAAAIGSIVMIKRLSKVSF